MFIFILFINHWTIEPLLANGDNSIQILSSNLQIFENWEITWGRHIEAVISISWRED